MANGWLSSTDVTNSLDALVTANPSVATRSANDWQAAYSGGSSGYIKIAATTPNSPPTRWPVLVTGGLHARELATADALVSFLEKLLSAYAAKSAITYPAWTDPADGTVYGPFQISLDKVRSIVEKLDLYVAPLVNDDGRDFVLSKPPPSVQPADLQKALDLRREWRKNRRPATGPPPDPGNPQEDPSIGVDLNRNFNVLWEFKKHYNAPIAGVESSTDPADERYIGPSSESEPETQNVADLIRTKGISFYLDVHMYARKVMYPWGIEADQDKDATQNFSNNIWDGKRDGTLNGAYGEYIPRLTAGRALRLAKDISNDILNLAGGADSRARTRSSYLATQAAFGRYVASGTSMDYCLSRWFLAGTSQATAISPVQAITIEFGGDPNKGPDFNDGGFSPDYVKQYPKLEREIHVATWTFLAKAAAAPFQGPTVPGPPSP